MLCESFPRAGLAVLPTPLDHAQRLTAELGGPQIYIKRDDRAGLSFGGNKARIFDVSMGEVLRRGCTAVVASAGVQSNKLREMVAAANKLGLKSVIVLTGSTGDEPIVGNLLLYHLLGTDIRFFADPNPFSPKLLDYLHAIADELATEGHKPYVVHRTLLSGTLGAVAYVDGAEELHGQLSDLPRYPNHLYMVLGAGITMGGMVLGLKHLGAPVRVTGVSSVSDAPDALPELLSYAEKARAAIGLDTRVTADDFDILDQYRGSTKASLTPAIREAIRLVAQTEGVFIEPLYTAKAMAGLIDQVRKGSLTADDAVVFLHSGGLPGLFVYGEALLSDD